jgi:hypothetical protein
MSDGEQTPEQAALAMYAFADNLLDFGVSPSQVEEQLIERGLESEGTELVVRKLLELRLDKARKDRVHGACWCIGGILLTVGIWLAFADRVIGGTSAVGVGAMAYGAIRYLRGVHANDELRGIGKGTIQEPDD